MTVSPGQTDNPYIYMYTQQVHDMIVLLSAGYLNSSKVVQESVQSGKDQAWLK
jgi:hypothetical protein